MLTGRFPEEDLKREDVLLTPDLQTGNGPAFIDFVFALPLLLQEALCSALVLVSLDYDNLDTKPHIVTIDAGPTGYGAVLQQENPDGSRNVCRYISHSFKKTRCNYPQVKKELYDIKCTLKKLRMYLAGIDFTVESDCLPLCQLIKNPDTVDPIFTRWISRIHIFNPKIVHIPGKTNVVADALSRRPSKYYAIRDPQSEET
jgi:hypothetical protein